MGMSIEEAIGIITAKGNYSYTVIENEAKDVLVDTARKYQMVRADYENRLKADMVAMLTDIQLEIEELDSRAGYDGGGMPTFSTDYIRKKKVNELVQQKINALRGDNGKN